MKRVAVAATNLLGPTFAGIIYIFVTISVMGTANGIILGYIRLPYSLALRNAIPFSASIRKIHPKLNMPVNSAIFAIAVSCVWWVIHYLQNKYSLLVNGDIAEIAISMSYVLYYHSLLSSIQALEKRRNKEREIWSNLPDLCVIGFPFRTDWWTCQSRSLLSL